MATRSLARAEWQLYFGKVARELVSKRVEIQITSIGRDQKIAAKWMRADGIVYDPETDVLTIAAGSLDHAIRHPGEIVVEESVSGLWRIEVCGRDGRKHTVRLKTPVTLVNVDD